MKKPTPIPGISWHTFPESAVIEGRDGRASISFGGIPVPVEDADFRAIDGGDPDYDMVGRGIYTALRANPECTWNTVYAGWLRDHYPHLLAELASHIIMLDQKDVDVSYLDRKINYMKVMALLEPDNPTLAAELGAACLDRGLRMSSLQQCTVMIYRAEKYLSLAAASSPQNIKARLQLAEARYLIGRYESAALVWKELLPCLDSSDGERLRARSERIDKGSLPKIPPVDYLEAIGVAFAFFQDAEYEECAAILADVLDDLVFVEEFPLPEVWHHLGICYQNMAMPKNAVECFNEALKRDPGFPDSKSALEALAC